MMHRILVIDDDPAVTSLLKHGLSYEGFAVDTAKSGVEGLTIALLQTIAKEQGRSVVIVSHHQHIQDIADRVLWLEDGAFKEIATMVTDPVCKMKVEREKAVTTEWEGQSYSFYSKGCRSEFLEEPQQFLHTAPK